jgi:hypothetical protein
MRVYISRRKKAKKLAAERGITLADAIEEMTKK